MEYCISIIYWPISEVWRNERHYRNDGVRNLPTSILYCIVLHCIVLWCIVLWCIVLYCDVLWCIVLYCIVMCCDVLWCIVMYCIALYCIVLHCIALHCIALYCDVLWCIVLYHIALHWIVLYWLFQKYEDTRGIIVTMALGIFPLLYFFTFLYYTDTGSTFCVLLMYLLSLHESHTVAAGELSL